MNLRCALVTPGLKINLTHLCQVLVQAALTKLRTLSSRVETLALFSPNEKFEELSVGRMPYMMVPYVIADLELSARAMEPEDRLGRIGKAVVGLPSTLIWPF
jgi:immunoglobulin-binding protein 1